MITIRHLRAYINETNVNFYLKRVIFQRELHLAAINSERITRRFIKLDEHFLLNLQFIKSFVSGEISVTDELPSTSSSRRCLEKYRALFAASMTASFVFNIDILWFISETKNRNATFSHCN